MEIALRNFFGGTKILFHISRVVKKCVIVIGKNMIPCRHRYTSDFITLIFAWRGVYN